MSTRIVIADADVPETGRAVLRAWAEPLAVTAEIVWLSALSERPPKKWKVEPRVARALFARFWAIAGGNAADTVIFIEGDSLPGDLLPLLHAADSAVVVAPFEQSRLVALDWFVVNRASPDWQSLAENLRRVSKDYEALADAVIVADLPVGDAATSVLSLSSILSRPWYNPLAPVAEAWGNRLLAAIDGGNLSVATVEQEALSGAVRPSLAYQARHRIADSRLLPATILDLDHTFAPPELAVPDAQRKYFLSWRTRARDEIGYQMGRVRKNPRAASTRLWRSVRRLIIRPFAPLRRVAQRARRATHL